MSLQVWLPLNGNLNNNGLSNCNSIITASGATVNNNGKIGKTYLFDASDDYISINTPNLYKCFRGGSQPFTIAMWVYTTEAVGNRAVLFGDYGLSGTIQFNIELNSSNNLNNDIRFYWAGSPDYRATGTNVAPNTWIHIAIIYDGTQIKFYRNGSLIITRSGTLSEKNKTSGDFYLGRDSRTGATAFGGYMNDFRVYDEALSLKQVQDLSKALVCHYKLEGPGTNPNLLKGTNLGTNGWYFNVGGYYNKTIEEVIWKGVRACKFGITAGSSSSTSKWRVVEFKTQSFSQIVLKPSTNYVVSFDTDNKVINSCSFLAGNATHSLGAASSLPYITKQDGTYHYKIPITTVASDDTNWTYNDQYLYMQYLVPENKFGIIANLKLEEGTVNTKWIPHTEDAIYSAYDNLLLSDVSGNGYNATKTGTLTFNSNSPRYSGSTKFDGNTSYLAIGRPMPRDALTVNVWAYMDNWANYSGRMGSCTEGGGWNFEPMSGGMNFALGVGATSNVYMNNFTSVQSPLSEITSGWHMFTGTFDGIYKKLYIDGVLKGSTNQCQNSTTLTEATPIFYNGGNGVFIGAEAAGSATAGIAPFFNGSISDFRIYAIALSAEDIKDLYQTSGMIDKNSNVYTYKFEEE